MACRLVDAKLLSEPVLVFLLIEHLGTNFGEIWIEIPIFHFTLSGHEFAQ